MQGILVSIRTTVVASIVSLFAVAAFATSGSSGGSTPYDPSAESFKGFIKISDTRELFVDYVKAKPGKPTVVLLNGLTYSTRQWVKMVAPLTIRGVGVLRYDMFGQGETLLKYAPAMSVITYQDQVTDLKALLTNMKINGPYNIIGLSYGGGIAIGYAAAYPKDVKNMILIAPYTAPLDQQDQWIKSQIWATRQMFPYNPSTDEELYDYFLHQIVYATYPQVEPIVLETPYTLEAVFRMTQGIRKFRPADMTDLIPTKSLHLMIARKDQYIQPAVLEAYWDSVPKASRASRIFVNDTEHKMPEAIPNFTAAWVYRILSGEDLYFQGRDFEGYPLKGEVRTGDQIIKVGVQ